ncbi:eamA-like transporter family protein [Sarocladium implicatum]|nr:eamA-like transporter family protein [Sarocladium implicatum]
MENQSPSSMAPQTSAETSEGYSDKRHLLQVDHEEERLSRSLSPTNFHTKGTGASTAQWRQPSLSPAPSARLSPVPMEHFELQERYYIEPTASPANGFWQRNKPAILVAVAQMFAALMNMSARLLEIEGDGMHPFQVLLIRQAATTFVCMVYMWWSKTPDAPMGKRELWPLLILRGFSGFFGIFGMWYSMMYIPLADATVLTFLSPGVAGVVCYFALREPFTRIEQLATGVALCGVVLIAQPASLFSSTEDGSNRTKDGDGEGDVTAQDRLKAIGFAMLGVCGAACAFTCIRTIGRRAHPIISVNYFGAVCTIICASALVICPLLDIGQPDIRWITPTSAKQWLLFLLLGSSGFIMQYLLTYGLSLDKTNRANAMVYTHMLFAVGVDRWVFHHSMGLLSVAGCSLILGSAVTVMVMKSSPAVPKVQDVERHGNEYSEAEGAPMLVNTEESEDDVRSRTMR